MSRVDLSPKSDLRILLKFILSYVVIFLLNSGAKVTLLIEIFMQFD